MVSTETPCMSQCHQLLTLLRTIVFSFLKNQYQDVHTVWSTKAYVLDKERDKIENGRKAMERLSECGIRQYIIDKIL